jgi:hypothetical protein
VAKLLLTGKDRIGQYISPSTEDYASHNAGRKRVREKTVNIQEN